MFTLTLPVTRGRFIVVEVLFNDALNTFILRLVDVGHSDSERGNPLPSIHGQGVFYVHLPTERKVYTTVFVTPVVQQWLVDK